MNQWWLLAFLALLGGTFFLGDRYGTNASKVACDKIESAEQKTTIAAEQHVIGQVTTQGQINQNAETEYAKDSTSIDGVYYPSGVRAGNPAGNSVRSVSTSACGTQTSKVYKLTPEQCDKEEAKCNVLWNWAQHQAAVK